MMTGVVQHHLEDTTSSTTTLKRSRLSGNEENILVLTLNPSFHAVKTKSSIARAYQKKAIRTVVLSTLGIRRNAIFFRRQQHSLSTATVPEFLTGSYAPDKGGTRHFDGGDKKSQMNFSHSNSHLPSGSCLMKAITLGCHRGGKIYRTTPQLRKQQLFLSLNPSNQAD